MKRYRNGTTDADWEKYYSNLAEHEKYMESIKPNEEHFEDVKDYQKAMDEWHMDLVCNAPNKPGYQFSNND